MTATGNKKTEENGDLGLYEAVLRPGELISPKAAEKLRERGVKVSEDRKSFCVDTDHPLAQMLLEQVKKTMPGGGSTN